MLTAEDVAKITAIVAAAEHRIEARAQENARTMQAEILHALEGFARGNFSSQSDPEKDPASQH